ncbi:signal transduction histidine kinase [Robbsia andropogonis]|uniref:sensor histidine kinase n=1 Tax=Robbsia andropogonis TaxID=28092 RepID=UPI000695F0F3|nr:HAMP domain-containing sensor histidine kinase [Robbsia andropogonis]MCP1119721.1 HAMP domain-containing histidine kinase [Robbsia andropogonis]MCP1129704.1 HAMP domain-containing histidine kinase [Robbsia andropogonis]
MIGKPLASGMRDDVLAAVLESQPWGTLVLDRARCCVYASAGALRLLQQDAPSGLSIDTLLPTLAEAIRRQINAREVGADSHFYAANSPRDRAGDAVQAEALQDRSYRQSIGEVLARGLEVPVGAQWLWVREAPLRMHGAAPSYDAGLTTMSLVDATDMRRALDERMASLRFMSHDLRSPQNAILALTQLHDQDRQAFDECGGLQRIGELARFALSLGDDFVFDCVASGWQHRDAARFDLCALLKTLVPQWNVAAVYRGVSLRVWLADGHAAWMHGVKVFVSRALQNLVDNAIQASPRNAVVALSVSTRENTVVVTIQDEAGGLPGLAACRDVPMTDFESMAGHTRTGQGLGLRLSEKVVRMHGGKLCARPVWDDDTRPSADVDVVMRSGSGRCVGTVFEVMLPALAVGRMARSRMAAAQVGTQGSGAGPRARISGLEARDARRGS